MLSVDELRPELSQPEAKKYRPGQFLPGKSGNPGGQSRHGKDLRAELKKHGPAMISGLIGLLSCEDQKVKLEAIKLGLAYLIGKPTDAPAAPAEPTPGGLMTPEEAEAILCQ